MKQMQISERKRVADKIERMVDDSLRRAGDEIEHMAGDSGMRAFVFRGRYVGDNIGKPSTVSPAAAAAFVGKSSPFGDFQGVIMEPTKSETAFLNDAWDASSQIRKEFGTLEQFSAYARAAAAGKVKIKGQEVGGDG